MPADFPKQIAYFISGHGYGHAVRSAQLINALPETEICIFTTIEKSYFTREIQRPFRYFYCELDCGCIQLNAFKVDIQATYERYACIENQRQEKIAEYCQLLEENHTDFIISDIAPMAFTIARQLNLPSLAISNFTWAEIYEEYISIEPRFRHLLQSIREDYSHADCYAKLQPALDSHLFRRHVDVGLLCRRKARNRNWLFSELGLEQHKKLCLIYIGQYGLNETNWQNLSKYTDWCFIGIYHLTNAPENYLHINLEDSPIAYADLVANCDLVLAKLGYGTISESLYWKKPVAYPPRQLFVEFKSLENSVLQTGYGFPLSMEQLQNCELDSILNQISGINASPFNYQVAEPSIITLIKELQEQHSTKAHRTKK